MKSHFIKDTNKRYSIREDGIIISHVYKNDTILKLYLNNVAFRVNGKRITGTHNSFMIEYFGSAKCNTCSNRITVNTTIYCDKCKLERKYAYQAKWKKDNYEQEAKRSRETTKKGREDISRHYVCTMLKIPISDLTEELYQLKKITLKTKRLCQQKRKITQS